MEIILPQAWASGGWNRRPRRSVFGLYAFPCELRATSWAHFKLQHKVAPKEHRRDKGPLDGTSLLGSPALPRDRTAEATGSCRSAPRYRNGFLSAWPEKPGGDRQRVTPGRPGASRRRLSGAKRHDSPAERLQILIDGDHATLIYVCPRVNPAIEDHRDAGEVRNSAAMRR